MKTILIVFGTRPEAIKMCPLVNELKGCGGVRTIVCVTGQHRQMLDQVLEVFGVVPDYDLSIMKDQQTLFDVTSGVLLGMRGVIEKVAPDVVLVHGDTTTSFAAALAAFYLQVPVGHVEAGLRTNNLYSPFPEEFNRQGVDVLAAFHFAPTQGARDNLLSEGRPERVAPHGIDTHGHVVNEACTPWPLGGGIWVTGNTGIDALATTVREDYTHPQLDWAAEGRLVVITAHRRENLGEPMHRMFRAIRRIVDKFSDVKAIYPIHMNPQVREAAHAELDGCDRIRLIEPLDVLDFHNFLARSYLILTDSGGIQEEAPSLGKPVLVMRDTTERPEGVAAGTLKLVGTDEAVIYDACRELLTDDAAYAAMSTASNPYGDGHASERIADVLLGALGVASKQLP